MDEVTASCPHLLEPSAASGPEGLGAPPRPGPCCQLPESPHPGQEPTPRASPRAARTAGPPVRRVLSWGRSTEACPERRAPARRAWQGPRRLALRCVCDCSSQLSAGKGAASGCGVALAVWTGSPRPPGSGQPSSRAGALEGNRAVGGARARGAPAGLSAPSGGHLTQGRRGAASKGQEPEATLCSGPVPALVRLLSLLGGLLGAYHPQLQRLLSWPCFQLSWAEPLSTKVAGGGGGFAVVVTSIIILNVNTEKTPIGFGHFNLTVSLVEFLPLSLNEISTQVTAIRRPAWSPSPKCAHKWWEPVSPLCPVPGGAALTLLGSSGPAWAGCSGLHRVSSDPSPALTHQNLSQ